MWTPIRFSELYDKIIWTENRLTGEHDGFWKLIKIVPEKWPEIHYAPSGDGFWVVAICGYRVIWYNDIEEGFYISRYHKYGEIDENWSGQSELENAIAILYNCIKHPDDFFIQTGPSQNL